MLLAAGHPPPDKEQHFTVHNIPRQDNQKSGIPFAGIADRPGVFFGGVAESQPPRPTKEGREFHEKEKAQPGASRAPKDLAQQAAADKGVLREAVRPTARVENNGCHCARAQDARVPLRQKRRISIQPLRFCLKRLPEHL